MAKDDKKYEVITDKKDVSFGSKIYASNDGKNFMEHVVRRKYNFESTEEYNNYLNHWLKPMLESGKLFRVIS